MKSYVADTRMKRAMVLATVSDKRRYVVGVDVRRVKDLNVLEDSRSY